MESEQKLGLSNVAKDLLLFLTRTGIKDHYSHLRFHPVAGWQNICSANFSGDPRVSSPDVKVYGKPLTDEFVKELTDLNYLSGLRSQALSVTPQGYEKAEELLNERTVQQV